jgi:hypothetical protein
LPTSDKVAEYQYDVLNTWYWYSTGSSNYVITVKTELKKETEKVRFPGFLLYSSAVVFLTIFT